MRAAGLLAGRARLTLGLQTAASLRADTDAIADLDAALLRRPRPDAHGAADDLVADDAGVVGRVPARPEGVDVGEADAAVGDLDVDVVFSEGFGFERSPLQVAVGAVTVVGQPAVEFCVRHFTVRGLNQHW